MIREQELVRELEHSTEKQMLIIAMPTPWWEIATDASQPG